MASRYTFNAITGEFDVIDKSAFITETTDGITTIRWHASDGSLWDMTIDPTGAVITTAVTVAANQPWLSLGFTNFDT